MVLNLPRNSTNYVISGTDTFRLGSRMLTTKLVRPRRLGQVGANLQNIEKSARVIYIPDDGYEFTQVDQAGAEALIVAYLCRHANFRNLFLNNIKSHCYVALHVFAKVWQKELEHSNVNVKELTELPVGQLTSSPYWKSVDKVIRQSDKWPAERRYYYISKQICHACVAEDTEILTHEGWQNVASVDKTIPIAIWNTNESIRFEVPLVWHDYEYNGLMYHYVEPQLDQMITPNHRVVHHSNNKYVINQAKDLFNFKSIRIPVSGHYIGGTTDWQRERIQLMVAIQADGYHQSADKVRFRLVKQRKIQRLKLILSALAYPYTERQTDVTEITISGLNDFMAIYSPGKTWGNWLLNFSKSNLEHFIDELKYWDGTYEESYLHKREAYFSKYRRNCNWVKTICHLVGKQGTLNKNCNEDGFTVGINNRKKSRVNPKHKALYQGRVYCPTTSTGFFLIRRNGKISITGNSNYGMKAGMFQLNTLEKSKGRIVISKKEAEYYLETYHCLFPEIHEWHRTVEAQLLETRTLYNLFGHPRFFWYPAKEPPYDVMKKAYAFVPQSTVGMITRLAFTDMQKYIEDHNLDWHLMQDNHDSYLVMHPAGTSNEVIPIMQQFINREMTAPDGSKFCMKSEAQTGNNWSPASDKNEKGLRDI